MRPRRWLAFAVAMAAWPVLAVTGAAAVPARTVPAGLSRPAGTGELIYVANVGSGPVTAYAASSRGRVAPVDKVANPREPNTYWDPWGVAFDDAGNLYVQTFLSDADTFVFPPGAHGITEPSRIFVVQSPDSSAIAVDSKGFEYVAGGESSTNITVAAPGASGKRGRLYEVPAVRFINLNQDFNPSPSLVSLGPAGTVLAAVERRGGNAIEVFAGGAHGSARPLRVISGARTGLGRSCGTLCDPLAVAFSSVTGLIYVAVNHGRFTHISVFAGQAAGDAQPLRTIEGTASGLAGKVITGMAISPRDGTIYAMVKTGQFGKGSINAYRQTASGDTPPERSFSDRATGFAHAAGIAITG